MIELQSQPRRPSALTEWAYTTIKNAILSLAFPLGAQLHINELAERLGTSRTPIREALLRLEKDGLVKTVPRVGFFVTQITRRDLRELFELRELLEGYAVQSAAESLTDADLAYIDHLLEESVVAVKASDLNRFLQAEIKFHSFLMEHAPNRRLIPIMESLHDLTYRERVLSLRSLENVQESLLEHQQVADALHRRDGELAGKTMAQHIAAAKARLLQFLDLPEDNASNTTKGGAAV